MTAHATDAPWQELQHAFGRAHDVPRVLAAISQSRGRQLRKEMERLWERVLHQGSIYSASPPAVQALIPLAAKATGADRKLYYELLAEFASSARQAVRDGRAIPCCSGGDPEHGLAILAHILAACDTFAPDLASGDRYVRRLAADLLCCSADAGRDAAMLVCRRFALESDRDTRLALLQVLTRVSGRIEEWPGVLAGSLERETDPALRFELRLAKIFHSESSVDDADVAELISLFLKCEEGTVAEAGRLFEALGRLAPDRELKALAAVLEGCHDRDVIRVVTERLLRVAFRDQRSGWENRNCSLLVEGESSPGGLDQLPSEASFLRGLLKVALLAMVWKIFPFLLRRKLRQLRKIRNDQRYRIEYGSLTGSKPDVIIPLTSEQRTTLTALAAKAEVWTDQTNLWALFDLPGDAEGLAAFVARHT